MYPNYFAIAFYHFAAWFAHDPFTGMIVLVAILALACTYMAKPASMR